MRSFKQFLLDEATIPNKPDYIAKYIDAVWQTAEYVVINGKKDTVPTWYADGGEAGEIKSGTSVKIVDPDVIQYTDRSATVKTNKGYVKITHLQKPKATGGKGMAINLGDASEGVLYVAMWLKHTVARKTNVEKVSANDILSFIKKIKWKKYGANVLMISGKATARGWGGVSDTVKGELYLKGASANALTDPYNLDKIKPLATESAAMVNSRNFERFVKMLHRNEKVNHVEIMGLGPLDETGQKIDLKIEIDGKVSRFNAISLKRGSTQLGQKGIGGIATKSFESVSQFFTKYLSIDVNKTQAEYNDLYVDDAQGATKAVVKHAVATFNKKRPAAKNDLLINSFNIGAFGGDDITVFDIQKNSRINPTNVASVLKKFTNIKAVDTSKTLGEMRFMGKLNNKEMEIGRVRFKFEGGGKTKRIYFESSAALKKLFKI